MTGSYVRISSLKWADIVVAFAIFQMQNYLSDVWGLSFSHAAGILNVYGGITKILPVFFLFLVDAFLGNFMMLVFSNIAYASGIGFIAMSTPPVLRNFTGTCKEYEPQCIGHTQKVLLYTGFALLAVGRSGNLVSLGPFLEENESIIQIRLKPLLQLAGYTCVVLVAIAGALALPHIKPLSLRFGIPAICMAIATLLFLSGWCAYEKEEPKGSPLTNVCRVFAASTFNICKPLDDNQLYKEDGDDLQSFKSTGLLRCLEKAAIYTNPEDQEKNNWVLCSLQRVEEAKIVVRMVPMWMTFIICGIVSSIGNTYFLEQAINLNRKIGKWELPFTVFLLVFGCAKSMFNTLAIKFLPVSKERAAKRAKKYASISKGRVPKLAKRFLWISSKKYTSPIGIAVAMIFSVLCCITAAKVEARRLNVIRSHKLLDKPDEDIPMSIYWLLFQFFLLAGLDSFMERSVASFFDIQAPESMVDYLEYFTKGVTGLGFLCGVLSVYVVGKISETGGRPNWFQFTLNRSRLDRYYWVLASLSCVNLLIFILVAITYRYKDVEAKEEAEVEVEVEVEAEAE